LRLLASGSDLHKSTKPNGYELEKPTTDEMPLIVALDVDYRDSVAVAAGVWFRGWSVGIAEFATVATFNNVAEYQPGEFYRRELPCLLGVLARGPQPDLIVIDGYVWLGEGRPGLGAHLHEALDGKTPIIGVAKTRFYSATDAIPVCRAESRSPLYVSAVGVSSAEAAEWVRSMNGEFRLPTLLKQVDRLARTATAGI